MFERRDGGSFERNFAMKREMVTVEVQTEIEVQKEEDEVPTVDFEELEKAVDGAEDGKEQMRLVNSQQLLLCVTIFSAGFLTCMAAVKVKK